MHIIQGSYSQFLQSLEHFVIVLFLSNIVENIEPLEGGQAVVKLAVAADEAVCEGEEDAGDGAEKDES